jgi:hypothetical protein
MHPNERQLEASYVAEGDPCERSAWEHFVSCGSKLAIFSVRVLTTSGVVDNLLYDTPNVSIALRLYQLASVL